MVAINETAYPRFKYNATKQEIRTVYTPDEREQNWMRARRVNPQLQQVYIVYLKCFQRLGYFPKFSDIPNSIREHIAESLDRKLLNASYGDAIPGTTLRRLKTAVRRRCRQFVQSELIEGLEFWLYSKQARESEALVPPWQQWSRDRTIVKR